MRSPGGALTSAIAFCVMLAIAAGAASADDRSKAFERFARHDEGSAMRVDNAVWEAFLLNYIRPDEAGVHRVAYGEVRERDRQALAGYIDAMSRVEIASYQRQEQMAYWINLYNALVIKLVLDHYPIASIRKLGRQSGGTEHGPWNRRLIVIDGVSLSLDDIENRILKATWNDPRLHYAITCAAIGCPNLQPVPFTGRRIDKQLSEAAMAYVNDPRCIVIENGELHISSLYRWHRDAFGGSEQAIIRHLMAYAEPALAMALQQFDRVHGDHFDWRLNDAVD